MGSEGRRGALQLRIGPRFTVSEAEKLSEALLAMRPVHRLELDFTAVREFQDAAIAILARALADLGGAELEVRGLTRHQQRLLRYFGVETPSHAASHS
jgi:hypothetical protein